MNSSLSCSHTLVLITSYGLIGTLARTPVTNMNPVTMHRRNPVTPHGSSRRTAATGSRLANPSRRMSNMPTPPMSRMIPKKWNVSPSGHAHVYRSMKCATDGHSSQVRRNASMGASLLTDGNGLTRADRLTGRDVATRVLHQVARQQQQHDGRDRDRRGRLNPDVGGVCGEPAAEHREAPEEEHQP